MSFTIEEVERPDVSGMYAENRGRVVAAMPQGEGDVILFQGGVQLDRDGTDVDIRFRQESHMFYLTGVTEPDFVALIEIATGDLTLFYKKLDDDHALWHGSVPSSEDISAKYGAKEALLLSDLSGYLAKVTGKVHSKVPVADILAEYDQTLDAQLDNDTDTLMTTLIMTRRIKSQMEIECMRYANYVSSMAHMNLWRLVKPGLNEWALEGSFIGDTFKYGLKEQAYGAICAAGKGAATLHYVDNDQVIGEEDLILIDAGAEFNHYASDITRCFPSTGKFTKDQKMIYDIVLKAHNDCIAMMKPGVEYTDVHRCAQRVICEGLVENQFITGDIDELIENEIPNLFFPHGVGHHIGLDVHDVGGYLEGVERIQEFGTMYLRARGELEENMVLTIEPGLYFVDAILRPALQDPEKAKFLNEEEIAKFADFGGVRIEDDVVVTAQGGMSLTTVPKDIETIEAVMAEN